MGAPQDSSSLSTAYLCAATATEGVGCLNAGLWEPGALTQEILTLKRRVLPTSPSVSSLLRCSSYSFPLTVQFCPLTLLLGLRI